MITLASALHRIENPQHPLHYFCASGLSYVIASVLTTVPGYEGSFFITTAILVDHFAAPYIADCLEPYREIALVPTFGHFLHLSVSVLTARFLFQIFFLHKITIRQCIQLMVLFKLTAWIIHRLVVRLMQ